MHRWRRAILFDRPLLRNLFPDIKVGKSAPESGAREALRPGRPHRGADRARDDRISKSSAASLAIPSKCRHFPPRRGGRVVEGAPLLREYMGQTVSRVRIPSSPPYIEHSILFLLYKCPSIKCWSHKPPHIGRIPFAPMTERRRRAACGLFAARSVGVVAILRDGGAGSVDLAQDVLGVVCKGLALRVVGEVAIAVIDGRGAVYAGVLVEPASS